MATFGLLMKTNGLKGMSSMDDDRKKELALETLDSIQDTIKNSDNKAASLMTAAGIIFGLSAFSINELQNKTNCVQNTLIYIFGTLYVICFIVLIFFLVLIVLPRRKNKVEKQNKALFYKNYSEDVKEVIKDKGLSELIYKETQLDILEDQIKKCARISHKKETLLRLSVWVLLFLIVCLATLLVLAFL